MDRDDKLLEHRERFLAFTAPYIREERDAPLRLKVEHSLRVLEHVRLLIGAEPPLAGAGRAALLAGLYHDCGRFPQFRRFRTFLDRASVNHARLGVAVIRKQGFLRKENPRVRRLARNAVLLHNRHALPGRLDPVLRRITDMVRDADKLDILRIMAAHLNSSLPAKDAVLLHVRDDPEKWSPKILEDVLGGHTANYADLHYVNDFRLLLGTWVHDLRFAATRRILRESGVMESVLRGLPPAEELRRASAFLCSLLAAEDDTDKMP
jgi:hypothetical protein